MWLHAPVRFASIEDLALHPNRSQTLCTVSILIVSTDGLSVCLSVCLSLVSLHRKQLCCKTCGADIPDDLPVSGRERERERERERPQWCSIRWIIIFWFCRKSTYFSIPSNIAPSAFYLYYLYFIFYNVRHFIFFFVFRTLPLLVHILI